MAEDMPFHIFGEEVPSPYDQEVAHPEAPQGLAGNGGLPGNGVNGGAGNGGHGGAGNGGNGGAGNGANPRLNWTPAMSSRMLQKFAQLVAEGIRTDKGFKDSQYNAIAKDLSAYMGVQVSASQCCNHLRKWRIKWVKIVKLKDLSGAGWDEDKCMITLDDEHYAGHIKDHPKDDEFLNVPLPNYNYLQTIFGSGIATGKYAMGSNDPLGTPLERETVDLDNMDSDEPRRETGNGSSKAKQGAGTRKGKEGLPAVLEEERGPKRKRGLSDEDKSLLAGMTEAVNGLSAAIKEGNHAEACPGIYDAVMACEGFSRKELMACLNYLVKNKGVALVFVDMTKADKELWLQEHLAN